MSDRRVTNPLHTLFIACLFAYGAFETWDWRDTYMGSIPWLFGGLAGYLVFRAVVITILFVIPQYFRYRRIKKATGRAGTAGFADERTIKKAGFFKKRKGFLMGLYRKRGVFVEIETSGLVLSPAGGGKTSGFVIPALGLMRERMFVTDLKGTLAVMMAKHRKKKFGFKAIIINPSRQFANLIKENHRYNPLQILIDDWENPDLHAYLIEDAKALAMQLHPDPPSAVENPYWRNGARKLIVFAFLYHVTVTGKATLTSAYELLCDPEQLISILETLKNSDLLKGDIANMTKDFLFKLENGDPKHIESFREGAVQVLDTFAPSGSLAESVSTCDFRFFDMRTEKIDIYIMADPTRQKTYRKWLGLLSWCAITELIRNPHGARVCCMLDEVTNFKIDDLPSLMTTAREFKIIIILIVQEIAQWAYMYGEESAKTLLSQTEFKLIMGVVSPEATKLTSDMLGEQSIVSYSHNLGASFFDRITVSASEGGRKLGTPDEVRRTDKAILIVRKERPILLDPIGYHEIAPLKHQVGINPLFGKPYKGKTRLKL